MNKKILVPLLVIGMTTVRAFAMNPVTIVDQGSFMAGGKVITAPGSYIDNEPVNFDGETLHGDAAYVFYQIPKEAKHNGIVFLHGYGQSGKSWESTPDGRDGFQNIFLEKGWKTYIVDEPRRGRGGNSTVPANLKAQPQDQLWFKQFPHGAKQHIVQQCYIPERRRSIGAILQTNGT